MKKKEKKNYLIFLKTTDGMKIKVHESEFYSNNLNPVFQPVEIKLQKLCNGDHNRSIQIEILDHQESGDHKYFGETSFTIKNLIQDKQKEFILKDKMKNVGSIVFEQAMIQTKPEFIDYLRGGVQLNLILAIDFTGIHQKNNS